MKKIFAAMAAVLFAMFVTGQPATEIQPQSSLMGSWSGEHVETITLPSLDPEVVSKLDAESEAIGNLPLFARGISCNISLKNSGTWLQLPNGDRVWRLTIYANGAQALTPYFSKFYLPQGSTLHVYNTDKTQINGAFTSEHHTETGNYCTGVMVGETFTLEYYEPMKVKREGILEISEVDYAYRWMGQLSKKRNNLANDTLGFGESFGCEVNVNCQEGNGWEDQKRATMCIIVKSSFGQGICSGSLINTVRQDCTPYILSAQHCTTGSTSTLMNQWLFYFNYEAVGCVSPSVIGHLGDNFIGGCSRIADSNDFGGDNGSDFVLLQLNNTPPSGYNVYYAGWNNTNMPADSGVSIHHPAGDIKKISTFNQPLVDTSWGGVAHSTHWEVRWIATQNGHGVTEGGSSGSALYNSQKQIVGTLTGGDSFCNAPNDPDQYGKIAYSWVSNGTTSNRQLKPWLDPDNTGATNINGRNADCTVGVKEVSTAKNLLSIYPNPTADGTFHITFSTPETRVIRVYNMLGKIISETRSAGIQATLTLHDSGKGLYVVEVSSNGNKTTGKLIIE